MKDPSADIIARSYCLFREYHGLYEDDYEGVYFWDPVTGEFGCEHWSTAYAGGICTDESKFAVPAWKVYDGLVPAEDLERIKSVLRECLKEEKFRECFFAYFFRDMEPLYGKYSYQKAGFESFKKAVRERYDEAVALIDDVVMLLYLIPDVTSGSYKNDKDSLLCRLEQPRHKNAINLRTAILKLCSEFLVSRRERTKKYEGTRFEGEIISVRSEYSTYGYRSDWKYVTKVGAKMSDGRTFWFKAPKGYSPVKGENVVVWSKDFTEYERSVNLRRPVVED